VLSGILNKCRAHIDCILTHNIIESVVAVILATKHMSVVSELAADLVDITAVMLDIDLSVLGRVREEYEGYEGEIRQEYIHVPWPDYCTGRARILRYFRDLAESKKLYQSEYFCSLVQPNGLTWHQNAVANMTWALTNLPECEHSSAPAADESTAIAGDLEHSSVPATVDEDEDIQSMLV